MSVPPGYQPPWVYTSRHPAINQWIRNNRETLRALRSSIGNFNVRDENYKAFLVELTKDENGVPRPGFVTSIIAKKTGNASERRKVQDFERQWTKRLIRHTRTDEEIAEELKQEKKKREQEKKERGCQRLVTRSQAFVCDDENSPPALRRKLNHESTSTTTTAPVTDHESYLFVFDQDEPVEEPEESVCLDNNDVVELKDQYVEEESALERITELTSFNEEDLSLLSIEELKRRSDQILNEISRRCRVLDEARKGGAKQTAEADIENKPRRSDLKQENG